MFQPRQDDLLTRLFNLTSKKHFIQDSIDLVEIEHQIQFTDIAEELVENLDEEMDGLEIRQLVVVGIHAHAEEETGVPAVDDLGGRQVLAHEWLAM